MRRSQEARTHITEDDQICQKFVRPAQADQESKAVLTRC